MNSPGGAARTIAGRLMLAIVLNIMAHAMESNLAFKII
jgi:hypothetical protein